MRDTKMLFCLAAGMFLLNLFGDVRIASAFDFKLEGEARPGEVIDGAKQKTIEVKGIADLTGSGYYDDLKIRAEWKNSRVVDLSPHLSGGPVAYSFPAGDPKRCGLVTFRLIGTRKGTKHESKQKFVYVDCQPPRVSIGKPAEGQMVKAGSYVTLQVRLEDDLLVQTGYIDGLKGYTLMVDVDGENVDFPALVPISPIVQERNIFIPRSEGRHGIRVRFMDRVQKTDEKTVWFNADGTAPQVRVVSPAEGQAVTVPSGSMPVVTVEVEAVDPGVISSGIDKVEFYLNDQGVAVAQSPSAANRYVGRFGVSGQGAHAIRVKAVDKVGNTAQATAHITVVFAGSTVPAGKPSKPSRTLPR